MTTYSEPLIRIVARAVRAGVELSCNTDGTLEITAPPDAVHLGRLLRGRDSDILGLLDWRNADVKDPAPCVLCRKPSFLRNPADAAPCHRACWELLWTSAAPPIAVTAGGVHD